jgi:hypothetical protein
LSLYEINVSGNFSFSHASIEGVLEITPRDASPDSFISFDAATINQGQLVLRMPQVTAGFFAFMLGGLVVKGGRVLLAQALTSKGQSAGNVGVTSAIGWVLESGVVRIDQALIDNGQLDWLHHTEMEGGTKLEYFDSRIIPAPKTPASDKSAETPEGPVPPA